MSKPQSGLDFLSSEQMAELHDNPNTHLLLDEIDVLRTENADLRAKNKRSEHRYQLTHKHAIELWLENSRMIKSMQLALDQEHCGETSCPRPLRAVCSTLAHQTLRSAIRSVPLTQYHLEVREAEQTVIEEALLLKASNGMRNIPFINAVNQLAEARKKAGIE